MNNEDFRQSRSTGKVFAGLILIVAGIVFLMSQMGYYIPDWVLSWPMFLIVLGLYIGAKHKFKRFGWVFVSLIGLVFLADTFFVDISISKFILPVLIILAGLMMIINRKRKPWSEYDWPGKNDYHKGIHNDYNNEDFIESVMVFGGMQKKVNSKDFKGGEIVCIFSGAEIDLSQAEIKGKVTLEITNVFGGTKLLVPANWEVKSEIVAVLGGIEDKRPQQSGIQVSESVLIIRGNCILGGIEIKSY